MRIAKPSLEMDPLGDCRFAIFIDRIAPDLFQIMKRFRNIHDPQLN